MQEITPFTWDRLYVFAPYTSENHINQTLGFKASITAPQYDEQQLLVFVRSGKVVVSFNLPRYSPGADFLPGRSYSPDEAIFALNSDNRMIKR